MRRDDDAALAELGLAREELATLGLDSPATGPPRTLVDAYIRRSRANEDTASLRHQLRDIAEWAARNGLSIRRVWLEQKSASKHNVRRQQFDECVSAILSGRSKTMAVWKLDRLDRRGMGAVGGLLDDFEKLGARLVCIIEGLDSTQPGSRLVFAIQSERAREEAKDISTRVRTGHAAHKKSGRRGPGRPPYGLRGTRTEDGRASGKVEPHPDEFPVARRIADLILGTATDLPDRWAHKTGEPLPTRVVADIINAEGHRTRSGRLWTASVIGRLAQRPLWAGMVPEREIIVDENGLPTARRGPGEPMLDDTGRPIMCGTGVVTVSEWYQIRELIRQRSSENLEKRRGKPTAKYLGTGIYRCGNCQGSLHHQGRYYNCGAHRTMGAAVCPGMTTTADRIDEAVAAAWIAHVTAQPPGSPVLETIGRRWLAIQDPETQARQETARRELEAAQRRVQQLEAAFYVTGTISEARFHELRAAQDANIRRLEHVLAETDGGDVSSLADPELLAEAWRDSPVAVQRMLLQCALGPRGIVVEPATRMGDRRPIMERLRFDWAAGAGPV